MYVVSQENSSHTHSIEHIQAEGQLYSLLSMRENQQRDPEIVKRLSLNSIKRLEKAVRRFPSDTDTRHRCRMHTFACACQREKSCEENIEDITTFTSNELEITIE